MNVLVGILITGSITFLLMCFVMMGVTIGENSVRSEIENLCLTKEEKTVDKSFVKLQISCKVVQ